MRKIFTSGPALLALLLTAMSCNWLENYEEGRIDLKFVEGDYLSTKAVSEIPDTNDFILTVSKSDGTVVYSGLYGASPENLLVSAGTYDVKAVSREFSKPEFSAPQYGDEQCVVVKSGEVVSVPLVCTQLNSGMRLNVSPSFLTSYPDNVLYLKSAEGKLLYSYGETRIAYFKPGKVSLLLSSSSSDKTLVTKSLASQEVMTLNILVSSDQSASQAGQGISVAVDTSRVWTGDDYVIGGDNSSSTGTDVSSAISVPDAREKAGATGVWVYGYIVGGDLSSSASGLSFDAPFSSRTNLAIASRSSVKTKSSCMSIQLPTGSIREALNLVDNPENVGKKLYVKGDIVEAYYGIPGVKNITDYVLK